MIPIWTVDKNSFGELAKSNATLAFLFPFLAAVSSRFFLAEIYAISDIEKTPFKTIRKRIIKISIVKITKKEQYSVLRNRSFPFANIEKKNESPKFISRGLFSY